MGWGETTKRSGCRPVRLICCLVDPCHRSTENFVSQGAAEGEVLFCCPELGMGVVRYGDPCKIKRIHRQVQSRWILLKIVITQRALSHNLD